MITTTQDTHQILVLLLVLLLRVLGRDLDGSLLAGSVATGVVRCRRHADRNPRAGRVRKWKGKLQKP